MPPVEFCAGGEDKKDGCDGEDLKNVHTVNSQS